MKHLNKNICVSNPKFIIKVPESVNLIKNKTQMLNQFLQKKRNMSRSKSGSYVKARVNTGLKKKRKAKSVEIMTPKYRI